ncbi:MAG: peptidylprolyl isomerase [Planctomycetes bacterium]|nr:peptidylprolyl isomerase [Planctomycetota bacterium]
MSATPPQLEGSESPSQIEFLWERYRRLIQVIVGALFLALLGNYGWRYMEQTKLDSKWSKFASSISLDEGYVDIKNAGDSLTDQVDQMSAAELDTALAAADSTQKPFVLLAIARNAMHEANWDRAEKALADLEKEFPNHSLVQSSPYPVQIRKEVKKDEKEEATNQRRKPEYEPAQAGSVVGLMREQIAAAKVYQPPAQFAPITPPADATKVKFTVTGGRSFVIALMDQTPEHKAKFLDLARKNFWVGLHVDEIQRPGEGFTKGLARQMHFGYESTKELDSTKWTTTEPSKNTVPFENSDLSHFPGAVSARTEADGKSAVDRIFIVADDASRYDGERCVFGYVVEGLDAIKSICEEPMTAQEEEAGRGKPAQSVAIESVEVLGG